MAGASPPTYRGAPVFGSIQVMKNSTVNGDSAVGGNQTVTGNHAVTGNGTVTGNQSVTGSVTAGSLASKGDVTANGVKITKVLRALITRASLVSSPDPTGWAAPGQDSLVIDPTDPTQTSVPGVGLGILPAGARIVGVRVYGPTGSNAGTTAAITVGFADGSGHNEVLASHNVKGSAGVGLVTPVEGVLGVPDANAAHTLVGIYTETGTASTAPASGGWEVAVEYI